MNHVSYAGYGVASDKALRKQRNSGLYLAWGVEIVAVAGGLALAVCAGLEGGAPDGFTLFIGSLPFLALSLVELTKIPIIAGTFRTRSPVLRAIGLVALLAVTAATFENFVFGFERGFNDRQRFVTKAEERVREQAAERELAGSRVAALKTRLADTERSAEGLRRDADAFRQQAQADIADTNSRAQGAESVLGQQRERAQKALSDAQTALARCGSDAPNCRGLRSRAVNDARVALNKADAALASRLTATDGDRRETRQRRDAAVAAKDAAVAEHEAEIAKLRQQIAEGENAHADAERAAARAASERADLVERSQIHRMALALFASRDDEAVAATKKWFVASLAGIVALIGTVLAALHYSAEQQATRAPAPATYAAEAEKRKARGGGLRRAARGWFVQRRRTLAALAKAPHRIVYLPLDATASQVAEARRKAMQESVEPAGHVPDAAAPATQEARKTAEVVS